MVILITGASHTGKTLLAQRLLEKLKFPYLSIDHLKMGLIRSGNTALTPEDDEKLTDYLWPIVREIIKTAIENEQDLIVEGCYVPFSWRAELDGRYQKDIRFICLAMTEDYIDAHFGEIEKHGSDIEKRLFDDCTKEELKAENRRYAEGFTEAGERVALIENDYQSVTAKITEMLEKEAKTMKTTDENLTPGKHFPENMTAPDRGEILAALAGFGIAGGDEIRLIDTSHGADDIRLNYIIDKKWVLRFCNAPEMTEKRMNELNRLIGRYKDFGLRCPAFIPDKDGAFFRGWHELVCYLAEYVDLPLGDELSPEEQDALWPEVLESVARFAERYKNVDLIDTMGMYSLFDLAPYDIAVGKDEKQQNFERLTEKLREMGETALAERLEKKHSEVREKLRAVYRELPRCVFQADENLSNVLIDENKHMAGLIDFNNAGTEVIVNQFANLGGGFDEDTLEPIGAGTRLENYLKGEKKLRARMLGIYHATELEERAMEWYGWIAAAAGWPQVCFFIAGLESEKLRGEILDLLALIAELPCD